MPTLQDIKEFNARGRIDTEILQDAVNKLQPDKAADLLGKILENRIIDLLGKGSDHQKKAEKELANNGLMATAVGAVAGGVSALALGSSGLTVFVATAGAGMAGHALALSRYVYHSIKGREFSKQYNEIIEGMDVAYKTVMNGGDVSGFVTFQLNGAMTKDERELVNDYINLYGDTEQSGPMTDELTRENTGKNTANSMSLE